MVKDGECFSVDRMASPQKTKSARTTLCGAAYIVGGMGRRLIDSAVHQREQYAIFPDAVRVLLMASERVGIDLLSQLRGQPP